MRKNTVILVPYADYHANSQVGLCHSRGIERELGGWHTPSVAQGWLWECWMDFWSIIKAEKKKLRAKVIAVSLGDGADDNAHSRAGLINQIDDLIVKVSIEAQEPVVEVADIIHYIAGTPAHVGKRATLEELVACAMAQKTEVYKNPNSKRYINFRQLIRASGVLVDCAHKPISTSTRYHTKGGGAMRTAHEIQDEYLLRGEEVPQVAFRGHFHHDEDSGINFKIRVFFCPGWKLHGVYDSLQRGFSIQPIGGWYLVCKNGEYREHLRLYNPERDEVKEY